MPEESKNFLHSFLGAPVLIMIAAIVSYLLHSTAMSSSYMTVHILPSALYITGVLDPHRLLALVETHRSL